MSSTPTEILKPNIPLLGDFSPVLNNWLSILFIANLIHKISNPLQTDVSAEKRLHKGPMQLPVLEVGRDPAALPQPLGSEPPPGAKPRGSCPPRERRELRSPFPGSMFGLVSTKTHLSKPSPDYLRLLFSPPACSDISNHTIQNNSILILKSLPGKQNAIFWLMPSFQKQFTLNHPRLSSICYWAALLALNKIIWKWFSALPHTFPSSSSSQVLIFLLPNSILAAVMDFSTASGYRYYRRSQLCPL